jgi:hypothetical protein
MNDTVCSEDHRTMIASLEKRIADNPDDLEGYYRLGSIYEHIVGDDARAKHCYLMQLVRTLGCENAEDAVRNLRETLEDDPDNCMAHIDLGQIFAYRNRFDDAERELRLGTRWHPHESPHFRFHVIPGSTAFRELEAIERMREDGLKKILETFQIDDEPGDRIDYFFYESRVHKGLVTDDQMPAHTFVERAEIHAVFGLNGRLETPHEDAHVVLGRIGRPPKLIEEGAAEYVQHGDEAHAWCTRVLGGANAPSVETLIDNEAFGLSDLYVTYPVAASFVGFLVERYGVDPFKRLYAAPRDAVQPAFVIYGKSWSELESEWRAFIAARE